MSLAQKLLTGKGSEVAATIAPLARLEIASIGAILSASKREHDAGYVMLFHETKTGKQANVEQINTLLRLTRSAQVESGGLAEPALRLQTIALQAALLKANRLRRPPKSGRGQRRLPHPRQEGPLNYPERSKHQGDLPWHYH